MRRAALLLAVLALAGCGGAHTTKPNNKASRPVTKPYGRPIDFRFAGGSGSIQAVSNTRTAVSLQLTTAPAKGTTAELDKGSCGAPKGLQPVKPLGTLGGPRASWSVAAPLKQLTASPLAFVLRTKAHTVLACTQLRSG